MKRVSLILAFGLVVLAQVPNRKPAFEVASIKLDPATGGNATLADQPGGRFVANHITLRRVIQFAYRDNQQFLGGPDWLDTDRWNLEAKAPDGTVPPRASAFSMSVPDTTALMMQSLLEDRFKLAAHLTKDERDVYALVVGKNGPKLKATDPDARNGADLKGMSEADLKAAAESMAKTGTAVMARMPGGNTVSFAGGGNATIHSVGVTLGQLADSLTRYVDRPVMDATGIEGKYDFTLEVPPGSFMTAAGMESQMHAAMGAAGMSAATAASDPSGASVFESVQKYGLRLEKRKAPIDTLVVDSAEKAPTEN